MKDRATGDIAGIYGFVDDIEQLHQEIRSALRDLGTRSAASACVLIGASGVLYFALNRL